VGLIKLKEGVGLLPTSLDIIENPKNLKIVELEAPQLPRSSTMHRLRWRLSTPPTPARSA
jgi:ABC-type metal ion transport system substrate-binding protein